MIGYHYTTWENYQKIKCTGIKPTTLSESNQKEVAKYTVGPCIWVYIKEFTGLPLIGQIFYVSCKHNSTKIVCLEVEVDYKDSVKCQYEADNPDEDLRLSHKLSGVGQYGHVGALYDLIEKSVPPENVKLINSWNILEILK